MLVRSTEEQHSVRLRIIVIFDSRQVISEIIFTFLQSIVGLMQKQRARSNSGFYDGTMLNTRTPMGQLLYRRIPRGLLFFSFGSERDDGVFVRGKAGGDKSRHNGEPHAYRNEDDRGPGRQHGVYRVDARKVMHDGVYGYA